MCGIFGVITSERSILSSDIIEKHLTRLFLLSESRGKEASGLAIRNHTTLSVEKVPLPASTFIHTNEYKTNFKNLIRYSCNNNSTKNTNSSLAIIGHSRLVTNGRQDLDANNQPIVKEGAVCIHNGIIVNDSALWKQFPEIRRSSDVDTEVFVSLLQMFRQKGSSVTKAAQQTFELIDGAASISVLFNDTNKMLLATNTGSLYSCVDKDRSLMIFASEKFILRQLIDSSPVKKLWEGCVIEQISPFSGCVIDIRSLTRSDFSLKTASAEPRDTQEPVETPVDIVLHHIDTTGIKRAINSVPTVDTARKDRIIHKIQQQPRPGNSLKRCTKCLLPETFPSIEFDENGVCNFCRDYKKVQPKGLEALEEAIAPYRSTTGEPDCIVGFSGGRDSSFVLHYVKNVLKMNPIAYTYDWGMVTDLARRNQARICGKLGIEHILISADIERKRENIRKNVQAWLKRPDLGMIPLLMAGDKQFYYFAHQLMEQIGVKLVFNGGNDFEKTGFKVGFCGINQKDTGGKGILTGISSLTKLKLLTYYAKQYLLNPSYINSSLFDTLHAYYSSYILPDAHIYFFHYIRWDEKEVVSTIRGEYDWEVATDTDATWRIGDGTAAFYDYIYYTVAGFSEFDTFRSNQIREGLLTREEALKMVSEENIPRYESLEWYAQTVGFDLEEALDVIHAIPKLYKTGGE
jgi:glutamine---fructose-6-phosphate transaminase (isomerizing)